MQNKREIIRLILNLPRKLARERSKSFYTLLEEAGYFEISNQIDENDIFEAIKEYSEVIDSWFILSSNKRVSSGWFIKKDEKGGYVVSFFPRSNSNKVLETKDIKRACAYFIKKELGCFKKK